jgi:nitric oxide reductase subunit B
MQGLNTTPLHGHAAALRRLRHARSRLMLFTLRAMNPAGSGATALIKFSFWSTNAGLMAMVA